MMQRNYRVKYGLLVSFLGLLACAENTFKGNGAPMDSADAVGEGGGTPVLPNPPEPPAPPAPPVVTTTTIQGSPVVSVTDEQRVQSFRYGQPNPKVDYLFILDNSVSMKAILNNTKAGFASLVAADNIFSPDSQIAVMNTMIGDATNLSKPGIGISTYNGIEFEPGFLDFIDRASILNYKAKVPGNAALWPLDGCAKKWFLPGDKDDKGNSCFDAAVQTTASAIGGEPGIHAFLQLMQKNKGKATFRADARVNVIFVSDTHDPGINNEDLLKSIPTYQQLETEVLKDNKISALRFHAIAPDVKCTSEEIYTKSYYKLAEDSKGEKTDVCTLTNYSEFLKRMIARSQLVEPLFKLGAKAKEVLKVTVDGAAAKAFSLSEDKSTLRIEGLDPLKAVEIKVIYSSSDP